MSADILGKSDDEASLQKKYFDQPYIKHEWEELVTRLCTLDDPKLKKIGYEELEKIRAHQRGVRILEEV
jgi:hypothetical protein